ncbi:MAG: hypothetical protein JST00_32195 [Deltaproteobacteria bacterium]|nr:hypothetical protein [Deltaproteobacteria bacterium]
MYHPGPQVPRRMYFDSCSAPGGETTFRISATITSAAKPDQTSGAILEAILDPATGALKSKGAARLFPECVEMHGVASKSDCSMVGALCRRPTRTSETVASTKDMVAALPDEGQRSWMTQPGSDALKQKNDEEWLYEWGNGDIAGMPATYVAHKAIGGWAYGRQALLYGQTDDSFGLSLKATVYGGGTFHEGDAFLVVKRSDHSIDRSRGWYWGCAAGHTIFNHAAFNPATSEYGVTCGTDLGTDENNGGGFAGLWMHTEKGKARGYLSTAIHNSIRLGGGPTSLVPLADGGFLGVFTAAMGVTTPNVEYLVQGPVSSIGIARFDRQGAIVGQPKILVDGGSRFLSYPQLAPLGDGTFLLGYGEMASLATANTDNDAVRLATTFKVFEIDAEGKALTPVQTLTGGAGWGEQDEMVSLGKGRVGWAYTPNAAREGTKNPACASNQLALHVYTRN